MATQTLIRDNWHLSGMRRSARGKSNRYTRIPANALNYAYAVFSPPGKDANHRGQLRPDYGPSNIQRKYRDALVLDRMEPLRPVVDGFVLALLLKDTLSPGDFTITKEGYCRLNPQLARKVVGNLVSLLSEPHSFA